MNEQDRRQQAIELYDRFTHEGMERRDFMAAMSRIAGGAAAATAAGVAMIGELEDRKGGNGKVGAVGFCWGGAYVNRLAVAAGDELDAGVIYYGPAPDVSEAAKVDAPLMFHLAGLDERVNTTALPWITALREAGEQATYHHYDGVNHAFNNDTSAERYDKAAAGLAWQRTLRFFKKHLA